MGRVLVVDDEEEVRLAIRRRLERAGHNVEVADCQSAGEAALADNQDVFDLVVTDMSMEDGESGVKMLKAALERNVFTEVIVLTAYGNVRNAVECMKLGAYDYVEKNIPDVDVFDLLALKVDRALESQRLATRAGSAQKVVRE